MNSKLSIGFVLLLLTFSILSSCPITSSVSAGYQNPIRIQGSVTPSAESPSLTWTSRTQNESLPLGNGSIVAGDHVVLNATFPEELNVTRCEIRVWSGFSYTTTRPLVIPTDAGGAYSGFINHTEFDWVIISGIEKGLQVNITCNFTSSDVDFMAWDGLQDPAEYAYDNNIVDMASGDKPENDVIIWESDNDTLILGCLNYCGEIGNWTLHLEVGTYGIAQNNNSTVTIDTYDLGALNQTFSINVTGYTESNTMYSFSREYVRICNFFAPKVTVYDIVPLAIDEKTFNISWSSTDRNADDMNIYSLWLSNNYGYSYMLLAQNLTVTWYLWNSSDWLEMEYMIRVRAYSIDLTVPGMANLGDPPAGYWPGDFGDGFSTSFLNFVIPIRQDVNIIGPSDIYYEFGSLGNSISWDFEFSGPGIRPEYFSYTIYRDSEVLKSGYIDYHHGPSGPVLENVNGLQVGTYNYTLRCYNPGESGGYVSDVVLVTVNAPLYTTNTTTITTQVNPVDSSLLWGMLAIGISTGSIVIIIAVIFLSYRLKRRSVVEYTSEGNEVLEF